MSAREALLKYNQRYLRQGRTNKRTNKKPEQKSVKDILSWCQMMQWSVDVVESKAVYSAAAGRYLRGQTAAGFTDIVGNTSIGQAVYIEAKAKGRRSTIKPHQVMFIERKIKTGCFALCADSSVYIDNVWSIYKTLDVEAARKFLLEQLPKSTSNDFHI